jgi:hypothetical protein
MNMRFASAGILLCAASVATAACGASDSEEIFGFPPPPEGSTCQEAVAYLQENFGPPGEVAEGALFYLGPDVTSVWAVDFHIVIEGPQTRDEFLRRRAEIETGLNAWLAPADLAWQQFRILWSAEPGLRAGGPVGQPHQERDPETGRLVDERLTREDQFSGSLCQVEGAITDGRAR